MANGNRELIHVETYILASLSKVWECWTQSEHIQNWNFASEDWACPNATNDLQVGRKFVYRMEARDGSFGFDFTGTYNEIDFEKRIKYTIDDGRKVEIIFVQVDDRVLVSESFEAENMNPVEMQREGWQAILNNFKKLVESIK